MRFSVCYYQILKSVEFRNNRLYWLYPDRSWIGTVKQYNVWVASSLKWQCSCSFYHHILPINSILELWRTMQARNLTLNSARFALLPTVIIWPLLGCSSKWGRSWFLLLYFATKFANGVVVHHAGTRWIKQYLSRSPKWEYSWYLCYHISLPNSTLKLWWAMVAHCLTLNIMRYLVCSSKWEYKWSFFFFYHISLTESM